MEKPRPCPVCHTGSEKAKLFLEKNIDPAKLSGFSFSSRKTPEFMCHRLVQCPTCDLVYANQPPGEDELAHAYHVADYDSSEEANDAAAAYIRAIRPTLGALVRRQSALEIGTGTGIFLEYLSREGFTDSLAWSRLLPRLLQLRYIVRRGYVWACSRRRTLPQNHST